MVGSSSTDPINLRALMIDLCISPRSAICSVLQSKFSFSIKHLGIFFRRSLRLRGPPEDTTMCTSVSLAPVQYRGRLGCFRYTRRNQFPQEPYKIFRKTQPKNHDFFFPLIRYCRFLPPYQNPQPLTSVPSYSSHVHSLPLRRQMPS